MLSHFFQSWRAPLVISWIISLAVMAGFLPREASFFVLFFGLFAMTRMSLENAAVYFVGMVPCALALPITQTFDNFNMWRLFAVFLVVRGAYAYRKNLSDVTGLARSPAGMSLIALFSIAVLSLSVAGDSVIALKRLIYFANALLPLGVIALLSHKEEVRSALFACMRWVAMLLVGVAGIQLFSTYIMDIYAFMRIWGEGVQLRQFGTQWSEIVTSVGNTWFAYYGEQLSLRIFSLLPDSHTFPMVLIALVPAVMAAALAHSRIPAQAYETLRRLARTRVSMWVAFVPVIFLFVILSGTRGMWVASIGVVPLGVLLIVLLRHTLSRQAQTLLRYVTVTSILFFALFFVAWPIVTSPQFLLSKGDDLLFTRRLRSIIDFGETSNSQRIAIWRATLDSIEKRPLLGVGIGQYPIILDQELRFADAGSSAHNVYLHIAGEIGLFGLLAFTSFLASLLFAGISALRKATTPRDQAFLVTALIMLPWIWAYLITDAALFDERALLLIGAVCAVIMGYQKHEHRI
ncbi:MAG: O-antigen ligase family protein [Patescibacteria group bacterium]